MRINRDQMLMSITEVVSQRGTCDRLQVGAILSIGGRVISTGYNGSPQGSPHCGPLVCDKDSPCTQSVHAEANALIFAARNGVSVLDSTMYCTHNPCSDCAKLIINSGVSEVVYKKEFRTTTGIELLTKAGIIVRQFNE